MGQDRGARGLLLAASNQFLEQAGQVLAELTNCAVVSTTPTDENAVIRSKITNEATNFFIKFPSKTCLLQYLFSMELRMVDLIPLLFESTFLPVLFQY